jgi:hypothetical protein
MTTLTGVTVGGPASGAGGLTSDASDMSRFRPLADHHWVTFDPLRNAQEM